MATSTVWTYFSPTTPGQASWSEDISGDIRLGSISGLAGEAEMGAVGTGNIVLDDPDGTVGHLNDGIVGLKQIFANENACPIGNRRLYTSYVADRRYHRGQGDSLITGVARKIDVTLTDLNSFLSFRVFAPFATDPTSSFVRNAESTLDRLAAFFAVDFISTTLFDVGYIPTVGGVNLDANDYTGSRPIDVLNDIANANKWNFWVKYHEATNQLVLWMDDWKTDGTATLVYDSELRLTNVLAEHDGVTTFAITPDAVGVLDPSRVVSAEYGTGTGVTSYRTRPTTAYTFAWRDAQPQQLSIKTQAKLDAALDLDLLQNSTEDNRISCTVQLPLALVTGIHEGMRLQVHFTHIPGVQLDFTWTRVLQRTIRQDVETDEFYWLDLELSPLPTSSCSVGTVLDPFEAIADLSPWSSAGLDYSIPTPTSAPSIMFAAAAAAENGTSIHNTIIMGSPWTLLDSVFIPDDPSSHELSGVGYLVTPGGTPPDLNINWQRHVEASTCCLACTIVTNETGPVSGQHIGETDGGGSIASLTLPNPITAGNLLLLVVMTKEGPIGPGLPSGWAEVAYRLFSSAGAQDDSFGLWMRCAEADEGDTVFLPPNNGKYRQAYLSEWAIT